ncbi:hypothetical protein ACH44C_03225 [Streptomyces purpureus]|uniref:hypothetical protein n=1 Tax=Streptomyces purpureus TaxID=1951 RepID=UPI001FD4F798|nr:hypothetical protein [Streptomyces purpureus]
MVKSPPKRTPPVPAPEVKSVPKSAQPAPPAPPAPGKSGSQSGPSSSPSSPAPAKRAPSAQDKHENGDEAIHTLLWTAATERPVDEVASLVSRLQETGELSCPADVALRAAAVSRPLDEVRQLVVLLNASGYDLERAETTLRAAAVGRPIEDVVKLVNIIGHDNVDWLPAGRNAEEPESAPRQDDRANAGADAVPAAAPKRRSSVTWARSALDGALAAGPGSHTTSSALRSVLRWPAAVALIACALVHVPMDLAQLRAGGQAAALSAVVTVLCLLGGVWLAVRDAVAVWAAAAGLATGIIVLHALEGAGAVNLLSSSPGFTYTWAKAIALLGAVAVVLLAGSILVRYMRTTDATDST